MSFRKLGKRKSIRVRSSFKSTNVSCSGGVLTAFDCQSVDMYAKEIGATILEF